jgi:S1-C subfamily serine protease
MYPNAFWRTSQSDAAPTDPDRQTAPSRPVGDDVDLLDAYSRAVIHVVETVSPAVVSLSGDRGGERNGSGSGFLIAPDGYAITNSHVVDERTRLRAETTEGDRLFADVIGDDPSTDIALVRQRTPLRELWRFERAAGGATRDCDGQPAGTAINGLDWSGERFGTQHARARRPADREHRSARGADQSR